MSRSAGARKEDRWHGMHLAVFLVIGLLGGALLGSTGCRRDRSSAVAGSSQKPDRSEVEPDMTEPDSESTGPDDNPSGMVDLLADDQDPPAPPEDLSSLQRAGMEALAAGETDVAYDIARQAMRIDDQDPQVIFLMAMVFAERQRFAEAIDMLDEVAATTPQARLPAMGQAADWSVRYGQWADAELRYRKILHQVPDSVLVHRNLASLLLRQGRRWEARPHLVQLCGIGNVTEFELRSMLTLVHPLRGDVEDKSLQPIGVLGRARAAITEQGWQVVRERLSDTDTRGPWENALRGRAIAALEDWDALKTWIVRSDASVNVSPDAWFAKGVYASSLGKMPEAMRCFAETVTLDPADGEGYARLAETLTQTDETVIAKEARQRAEWIEKTQEIGAEMSGRSEREPKRLLELHDLLRQLKRPLEAVGWRGVWLSYANASGAVSGSEAQRVLDELVRERTRIMREEPAGAATSFVLCGMDIDSLPMRDEVDQSLKSAAQSAAN